MNSRQGDFHTFLHHHIRESEMYANSLSSSLNSLVVSYLHLLPPSALLTSHLALALKARFQCSELSFNNSKFFCKTIETAPWQLSSTQLHRRMNFTSLSRARSLFLLLLLNPHNLNFIFFSYSSARNGIANPLKRNVSS